MDEFEKSIRTTLAETGKFDAAKGQALRKETVRMFNKKLKIALIIAWIGIAIACIIEVVGFVGLLSGLVGNYGVNVMIFFGVLALSGGQFHLLAKLSYWVYHNEMKVRQELKQLQLQIAEMAGKDPAAEK